MLPIGFLTDVSAGALASGGAGAGGAAAGLGFSAGGQGAASGFAAQLGGILQGEAVDDASPALAAKIAAGGKLTQDDLLTLAEDNPHAVALMPDGLLALVAPVPAPVAEDGQFAAAAAAGGVTDGAASAAGGAGGASPASAGMAGNISGAAAGAPPPGSAGEAAAMPQAGGEVLSAASSAGTTDGAAVPGLQGAAAETGETMAGALRGTAQASGDAAEAAAERPVVPQKAPETAVRRWRDELPQDLRAQGTSAGTPSSVAAADAGSAAGAALPAAPDAGGVKVAASNGGAAQGAVPDAAKAATEQGENASNAAQGNLGAGGGTNTAVQDAQPVPVTSTKRLTLAEAAPMSMTDPTPVAIGKTGAAGRAQAGGVPAQAGGSLKSSADAAGATPPVAGMPGQESVPTEDMVEADGAPADRFTEGSKRLAGEAGKEGERPAAANVAEKAVSEGPVPRGAAPVAAAALATQFADLDADGVDTSGDWTLTSDTVASTVRGGHANGAMRTESLQTPSQAQSGHVATQVAGEMVRNLKDGNTRFQMRFDPPELGRVEVKMKVSSDGSVHAHLIVDRPETLDMFLRDQRGLERALESAGLNTDSSNLQFSLKQDGGQQFGSGEQHSEPSFGGAERAASGDQVADPVAEEVVRLTLARQRGGLDMKV